MNEEELKKLREKCEEILSNVGHYMVVDHKKYYHENTVKTILELIHKTKEEK